MFTLWSNVEFLLINCMFEIDLSSKAIFTHWLKCKYKQKECIVYFINLIILEIKVNTNVQKEAIITCKMLLWCSCKLYMDITWLQETVTKYSTTKYSKYFYSNYGNTQYAPSFLCGTAGMFTCLCFLCNNRGRIFFFFQPGNQNKWLSLTS